ncbi:MAG: hypothetical protein P8Y71_18120 [Pseudolabrys sp.]
MTEACSEAVATAVAECCAVSEAWFSVSTVASSSVEAEETVPIT